MRMFATSSAFSCRRNNCACPIVAKAASMSSHAEDDALMACSYASIEPSGTEPSGRNALSSARIVAPRSPLRRSEYDSMHICNFCVTMKLRRRSRPAKPTFPTADVSSENVRMPTTSEPSVSNHPLCGETYRVVLGSVCLISSRNSRPMKFFDSPSSAG